MDRRDFSIVEHEKIAKDVYRMKLAGDTGHIKKPGQFVNIAIDGHYLRRPISISSWKTAKEMRACGRGENSSGEMVLIYKVVGEGTKILSTTKCGEKLDIILPLGNGFDIFADTKKPLLVGGGVGVPPLIGLAEKLIKIGVMPEVVLGFNDSQDVFAEDSFLSLATDIKVHVVTVNGSYGRRGMVTDVMKNLDFDYIYSCGPEPMLKALATDNQSGQFSFEARMACGFGACMGCSCKTKYGNKRICKDGPVLLKEEIVW